MTLNIVSMGKLKEDYLKACAAEYGKRIGAFAKLNIIELTPEKLPENPSAKLTEQALYKEAELILGKIPQSGYVCALCIEGRQITSEQFSVKLSEIVTAGNSDIYFIIGSSYGLSDRIKRIADLRLSVSEMTFPHQLFRIMLLEQLYRALSIQNNRKYHK